ncbi:hypothetical protein [Stenomitos frigidus]|uniref:hypothetical protein n=1 Tax=Stenomitos frigidus TaxID=1886765 RepID=UPI0011B262AC|nr:hypothetical protein [Stenomitos frigidus]
MRFERNRVSECPLNAATADARQETRFLQRLHQAYPYRTAVPLAGDRPTLLRNHTQPCGVRGSQSHDPSAMLVLSTL